MNTRFHFTLSRLYGLQPAIPGKRAMYHDTKIHFLKCRVTDKGCKTLIISAKVAGRSRKVAVHQLRGEGLDPTMEALRLRAREAFMELEAGKSPPDRRRTPTFGEYVEIWSDSAEVCRCVDSWRNAKIAAARRYCASLLNKKLDEIGRGDVRRLITEIERSGRSSIPRMVRATVKQVYELAIDDGVLPEDHPVPIPRNLKLPRNRRDRCLNKDEQARFWNALWEYEGHDRSDAVSFRHIVLPALFTGQRKGNILGMRWDEIDNGSRIWTIPAAKAKTRKTYPNPLPELTWVLLQGQRRHLMKSGRSSEWVFPSYVDLNKPITNLDRPWAWLVKQADLADFRFHDLRRTSASLVWKSTRDLKTAQLFLHHSDIRTTGLTYVHAMDNGPQIQAAQAVIEAICDAAGISASELKDKFGQVG